jgi:LuxR family transcriptional regulator, maltose regulon positive regulatory protein
VLRRLGSPPEAHLTLIRAPAGWGKSSLLAAWSTAESHACRFAWFAIDESDNDPTRFWIYLIEALRRIEPTIGNTSLVLLRTPGTDLLSHSYHDGEPANQNDLLQSIIREFRLSNF